MSWQSKIVELRRKYGGAAKFAAKTILGVVFPGSPVVATLVEQAFETARNFTTEEYDTELTAQFEASFDDQSRLEQVLDILGSDLQHLFAQTAKLEQLPDLAKQMLAVARENDVRFEGAVCKLDEIEKSYRRVEQQNQKILSAQQRATGMIEEILPLVRNIAGSASRHTAPVPRTGQVEAAIHAPTHLRIFLSSPGDLGAERLAAIRVIQELRYDPLLRDRVTLQEVAWEIPGAGFPVLATKTPQEAINQGLYKPSGCDIVVMLLAGRLGTPLPSEYRKPDGAPYRSGTEWEYHDALAGYQKNGRPEIIVYRRTELPALDQTDPELAKKRQQRTLVDSFFNEHFLSRDGSLRAGYVAYKTPDEFAGRFRADLANVIRHVVDLRVPAAPRPSTSTPKELPLIDSRETARRLQQECHERLNVESAWTNRWGMRFRLIPEGRSWMGASDHDNGAPALERPRRVIQISAPFWAATFPLTQGFIRRILLEGASSTMPEMTTLVRNRSFAVRARGRGPDDIPAGEMNIADVELLCRWMSQQEKRTYRLPTEAEWEYMARAGAMGRYWWEEFDDAKQCAVHGTTEPGCLESRRANAWGLIDVLGNIGEWTSSGFDRLDTDAPMTAANVLQSATRVSRGGCWLDRLGDLRLSRRDTNNEARRHPTLGARIVCEIESVR